MNHHRIARAAALRKAITDAIDAYDDAELAPHFQKEERRRLRPEPDQALIDRAQAETNTRARALEELFAPVVEALDHAIKVEVLEALGK